MPELKKYDPNAIYHNYILTNPFLCFDFITYYLEMMNEKIPVFTHKHNLYEVFYSVEGSIVFECEGQTETLNPGDFILLGRDYSHRIRYSPDCPVRYFTLIFDISVKTTPVPLEAEQEYAEISEILAQIDRKKYCRGHCSNSQLPILDQLYQESKNQQLGWLSTTSALYCQLFFNLLRAISPARSRVTNPMGHMNIALTATKYIHANYTEDITVEDLAATLNVTPRHINRLFQNLFGCSLARSVNVIRMEYAKQYLISGRESLERIAAHVGLPSGKVLSKLFHEQEGISPAQFRAQNRRTD